MREKMLEKAQRCLEGKRGRRLWLRVVTGLACVVVFCTVYALILPALTLEKPSCGLEEHVHTEECYVKADSLICPLPENEEHTHTKECYGSGQGHTHTEDCYETKRGELICGKEESGENGTLEDSAGQGELVCGKEESDGHTHTPDCGVTEQEKLICGQEESDGHEHTDDCYETKQELVCGQEKIEEHSHTEDCYDEEGGLICGKKETEGHSHTDECYRESRSLICGQEKTEGHHHSEECYEKTSAAACGLEETEGHRHSGECYGSISETSSDSQQGHHHTDNCYETEKELVCRLSEKTEKTEDAEETGDSEELTCKKPETEGHRHDEDCYDGEGELICELEESPGHKHSAICYGNWKLVCGLEEHTHTEECYDLPLTEEEQEQVDEVISLIDELPGREEIEKKMAAFEEAEDEDSSDAYLTEIRKLAVEAYKKYSALTEAQKKKVTNAAKLMELEWLWGGQTLASKPLDGDKAYISVLAMGTNGQDESGGISDGSEPWDSTDDDGLDKDASNRRVRTFDTVKYDFYYTTALQDTSSTESYDSARVYFEFLLPATKSQAMFSVDEMTWLATDNVSYVYEEELVKVNGTSYQVLHGSFLDDREGSQITAASRSRDVTLRVLNMKNNATIQPVFSVWMDYNEVGLTYNNNIPEGTAYQISHNCSTHSKQEVVSLLPDPVTVTCTPRYAVTLKRGEVATTSWKGDFDFSTGNDKALDKAEEIWNGEISAYGIRLMVQGLDAAHGLRGCAFPEKGDKITFTITLTTAYKLSNGGDKQYITQEFVPRVWSADEFAYGDQGDGRAVSGHNSAVSYAAPLNKDDGDPEHFSYSCKDGGTWTFGTPYFANWNQNHRVISVTVSDYEFDPEHLPYTYESGLANDTEFYNPQEVGGQWWNVQNAVFSTGEIWVVTPFYNQAGTNTENYITNVKDTESLTMWQDIYARDFVVKGADNTEKYRKWDENYHLDSAITLQNPGIFNAYVTAIKPLEAYDQPLTNGCWDSGDALKDYATPGSYVDLGVWVNNDYAQGDAVGVAYNVMTKFDNACFEPVTYQELQDAGYSGNNGSLNQTDYAYTSHTWYLWPRYTECSDYQTKWEAHGPQMLYGTTKDGQGWNHQGKKPNESGYDTEMMQATPDDLVWYDSMEDLKDAGAECVAVLMEYRNVANDGTNRSDHTTMNHLHMVVHGKIKDTAEPGYVYAISNYAAAWTKADVKALVTDANNDGQIGTMDYLCYTQNNFPSYSPTATNKMDSTTFPAPTHERSWDRCTNHGSGESGKDAVDGENGYGTATKSYLADDGTFVAGTGGFYFQDNIYVVSYKSEVNIQVAQKNNDGTARGTYDMDANQRVADFMVTPRFVRSATDTGAGGTTSTIYTDVTVNVTLDEGLEYYFGTAVWGGSYEQDSNCQSPGTVTGGQVLETRVVEKDGTTTLTWILKNVPLDAAIEDLDPIYFSCRIGNSEDLSKDVTNNQELIVQTDIYSTADQGAVHDKGEEKGDDSGENHNDHDSTSIKISKSTNLTIIKTADQPIVDIGESMGFTMRLYNGSSSPYSGWIVDVLPSNGEGKSAFQGALQIDEFKVVTTDGSWKNVTFYYTTDSQYSSKKDAGNLDVTGWSTFTLNDNYTWTPPDGTGQITAIACYYTIPARGSIQMHIILSLPESRAGDVIFNRLLLNNLLSNASCQIVSRTLEGLTWMDDNGDGIQDEKEDRRISGVKVELLKLKDGGTAGDEADYEPYCYPGTTTPIAIETGQQISVRAGSSADSKAYDPESKSLGRYKFTDLPAGTFAVRFTDGSTEISPLIASPTNRGTDDSRDSDGEAAYSSGKLQQTIILGIEMPEAEKMQDALHASGHHDSGFYKGHELPETGGTGTTPYTKGGLLLAGAALLLLYSNKKRRKEELASS